jgi:Protein of unknown function (DUF4240)
MDTSQFWRLIERSKAENGGDCHQQSAALTSALLALPAKEIKEFDRLFFHCQDQAYRNDLWAAAYIINGGSSNDGFEYFRRWLIGRGEEIYTAALRDPESLLSVVKPRLEGAPFYYYECEDLGKAARRAYEQKTQRAMEGNPRPGLELIGEDWDEEDLPAMFPKL